MKPRNPRASSPFGSRTRSDCVSPLTWTTRRTSPMTSSSAFGVRSSRNSIGCGDGLTVQDDRRICAPARSGRLIVVARTGPVVAGVDRGQDDVVRGGAAGGVDARFERVQAGNRDPVAAIVASRASPATSRSGRAAIRPQPAGRSRNRWSARHRKPRSGRWPWPPRRVSASASVSSSLQPSYARVARQVKSETAMPA